MISESARRMIKLDVTIRTDDKVEQLWTGRERVKLRAGRGISKLPGRPQPFMSELKLQMEDLIEYQMDHLDKTLSWVIKNY
jgi:hypothetical protein